MIGKSLVTVGVLACSVLLALPTSAAANYLPLTTGDTGIYEGEVIDGSVELADRQLRITDVQGKWRRFSDFLGTGPRWVWSDSREVYILVSDSSGNTAQRLFNANASVGTSFSANVNSCVKGGTISDNNVTLNLAGTVLNDVIRVDFDNICGEGLKSAWFAPGVGPVKWMEGPAQWSLERHYYRLIAGRINGKSYPEQLGAIEVDIRLAGGTTIVTPENDIGELPVWIEARNRSESEQTLTFRTGQVMEVEILDPEGDLVKRWSDERVFTQALMVEELGAGESRWFGQRFQLKDSSGQALSEGSYDIRVTFKGHPDGPTGGGYSDNGYFIKTIPLHLEYAP